MITKEELGNIQSLINDLVSAEVNLEREGAMFLEDVSRAEIDLAEYLAYLTDEDSERETCYDNGQSCSWANDGFGGETCIYCKNSRE